MTMVLPRLGRAVHGMARQAGETVPGALRRHFLCRRLLSNVAAVLESRAVLEISGVDARALLQGLMTNDISLLDKDKDTLPCISAAFLNPKGRVLGDALVTRSPRHDAKNKPGYLLDCSLSVVEGLKRHLKLYKLRSKVKIKDATTLYDVLVSGVHDPWQASTDMGGGRGDVPPPSGAREPPGCTDSRFARFEDPRCKALGVRLIRPKDADADSDGVPWPCGDAVVPEERYHALRMFNGVGEGSEILDSIPLESNLDLVGSISFAKGCYVGQELTARTHFKGFVRKRVLPVLFLEEGIELPASPIQNVSSIVTDARKSQGLVRATWRAGGSGGAPPATGSSIVNRAGGDDEKLGTLVAVSPEYNVGLALLRLGKLMSPNSDVVSTGDVNNNRAPPPEEAAGDANPAVDCRVVEALWEGQLRRCLPLTPTWWPADLDATTGKVPA